MTPAHVPAVSPISDVLALWKRDGWLTPPLAPMVAATAPVLGTVRTVQVTVGPTGPGLLPMYDVLSGDLAGAALVIAGAAELPGAMFGEILATAAQARGAAVVAIDGAVRDRTEMTALGLPVYGRGEIAVGPSGLVHVIAVDVPVTIGGVEIAPGDALVADSTGCVRVRAADATEVLDASDKYAQAEDDVLVALRAGEPLHDAYRYKKTIVDELVRVVT